VIARTPSFDSRCWSRRNDLDRFRASSVSDSRFPTPHSRFPTLIFLEPRLTVLSRPAFSEPSHLAVNWLGESTDGERLAEFAGRLCYMSQRNPANRTTRDYLENIKRQGHGSVLEHVNYSVLVEGVSRSLTHELVRHRAGWAYSQLSQRYVDESVADFVMPPAIIGDESLERTWREQVESAQRTYVALVDELMQRYSWVADKVHRRKMAREAARAVLPNATETKIVATGNVRAWRTMLELRSSEGAELEIRRFAILALRLMQAEAPAMFSDFEIYVAEDRKEAARLGYHKV
jgi:thymidylate synthase (FAD)